MLGILIELALSWIIVWIAEKKNLSVLGLNVTAPRFKGFALFFFIATVGCLLETFLRIVFFKEHYVTNPQLSFMLVLKGLWWNTKSVLYEELIFRGVLLYILIKRLGITKAILISAIAFGAYHWFSFNLLGNWVAMIYVFIITGIMGLILAYAYAKTLSMYIALGFHLGWNFVNGFVFSRGPVGNGVFIVTKKQSAPATSYFLSFTVTMLPILLAFLISYMFLVRWKRVDK
jgi:membrane protease YdiL (CAAX protease family)